MNKKALLLALIAIFSIFSEISYAKVFNPIQIFLPGNFNAGAINLTETLEPIPAACWKAPSLIETFKRFSPGAINIVYGTGNDSSIYDPVSFCSDGKYERDLIRRCRPDAAATAPDDLLIFRSSLLSPEIRQRILTNLEPENEYPAFPPFGIKKLDNCNLWFFNFFGKEQFAGLPLESWGQLKPENPARALRRINPSIGKDDISLSIVYLSRSEAEELVKEFNNFPGTHLIIQISDQTNPPYFSEIDPQRIDRCFTLSLKNGVARLPLIKIFRRNNGYPRLSLRLLPYEKAETGTAMHDFAKIRPELGEALYQTLTMITTRVRPSTAPFRFNPATHAGFCKSQTSSDVAIMQIPEENHKTDNVISCVALFNSFANEKIFTARIKGKHLLMLIIDILRRWDKPIPVFSGISFSYFADSLKNVNIGRFPLMPEREYSLTFNDSFLRHPVGSRLMTGATLEPFDGTTLWDIWKNQLKSLKIESGHLLD
ncbi:MAG: hypothetical protein ACOYXC_11800 [Candidatus Rifleibacteriota bacterium]